MPLPAALCGSTWAARTARKAIPLLVWCAEQGKTITYGQLDKELSARGGEHKPARVYGWPAGAIGDALIETEKKLNKRIPPLNALIVNATTRIPGGGCDYYINSYFKSSPSQISISDEVSMAEEIFEEVWRFDGWRDIMKLFGLKPLTGDIHSLLTNIKLNKPTKSGWPTGPESEKHKALKRWVAKNPKFISKTISFHNGEIEWLFASSDRVDVMFSHKDGCIAVEVKASDSNNADLERGIYQCIKYQALLRAELKVNRRIPNGSAILVIERQLPPHLTQLAQLLGVNVLIANVQE